MCLVGSCLYRYLSCVIILMPFKIFYAFECLYNFLCFFSLFVSCTRFLCFFLFVCLYNFHDKVWLTKKIVFVTGWRCLTNPSTDSTVLMCTSRRGMMLSPFFAPERRRKLDLFTPSGFLGMCFHCFSWAFIYFVMSLYCSNRICFFRLACAGLLPLARMIEAMGMM